jgi:excisionase family DNA binding protein
LFKTTTMIDLQSYVNVRDAAKQIGIHEESLRRLLRQGSPNGAKIGGQWFISKEQLALFATTYNARTGKRRRLI